MKSFLSKINNNRRLFICICVVLSVVFSLVFTNSLKLKNNSINTALLSCVLFVIIVLVSQNYKEFLTKRTIIVSFVFSVMFSLALTLQGNITFTGSIYSNINANTIDAFSIFDLFRFIILIIGITAIYNGLIIIYKKYDFSRCVVSEVYGEINNFNKEVKKEDKNLIRIIDLHPRLKSFLWWLTASLLVFLPIFLFWLSYYPGFIPVDALHSIMMGMDDEILMNNHPLAFTLILGNLAKFGINNNNPNLGIALFSLIQIIIVSASIGYLLLWLKNKGAKYSFLIPTYLLFASSAYFYTNSIILWKDTIFSIALLFLGLLLYDLVKSKGELFNKPIRFLYFLILSLIAFFWRNNGIYVLSIVAVFLFFINRKGLFVNILYISFLAFLCMFQQSLYRDLDAFERKEEALGIPIQQVARTISLSGDIAEEDLNVFLEFMPLNVWKENYRPMTVDRIKWNRGFDWPKFNEGDNVERFLLAWYNCLKYNFNIYVDSYLINTYGFWSFATNNYYEAGFDKYMVVVQNPYGFTNVDLISKLTGFSLRHLYTNNYFIGAGTLFWIMMFSISTLFLKKMNKYILFYIPFLACWITIMVATPVAFALRYMFMFVLALPVFVYIIFKKENE